MTNLDEDYIGSASPQWWSEMARAKQEQRRTVFLLHFNIRDLVFDPRHPPASPDKLLPVMSYLMEALRPQRHLVLSYSLHGGVEVYGDEPSSPPAFAGDTPKRLWRVLASHVANHPSKLTPSPNGPQDDPSSPELWFRPANVIPLLSRMLTGRFGKEVKNSAGKTAGETVSGLPQKLSLAVVLDHFHHLAPAAGTFTDHTVSEVVQTIQRLSTDPILNEHNHIVVLLTPELGAIHPELRGADSAIAAIRVARPNRDDRFAFLDWLKKSDEYQRLQDDDLRNKLANQSSGMNYGELRDFAATLTGLGDKEWSERLGQRRSDIIARESGGLLVSRPHSYDLKSVAGYGYVKSYFGRLLSRLKNNQADVPGVLLVGPPGTGKSYFAGALAQETGVNVVTMRNVRNMWVGQSERNLEQVFEVALALAPVIIFVDEMDQAFSNRRGATGDGGVEQRLLGRLLEFMDDKQNLGKVLWVAASNRPDLIDPAMLSRFRLRIPFLLPDRDACAELLKVQLPEQAGFRWKDGSWTPSVDTAVLGPMVGKYSGRELETIVRMARWIAEDKCEESNAKLETGHDGVPVIDAKILVEALEQANVGHDQQDYVRQMLLALQQAPFYSPELVASVQTALPEYAADIVRDGKIDQGAVSDAISRLRV